MRNTIILAYDHLVKDKVMSFLIDKFRDKIDWGNRYNSNYPLAISNLIIEQQISFKAAITVKKRFAKIVDKKSQSEIMNMSNTDLQSIGNSFRKAEYIKNVFCFFNNKTIDFDKMSDKEVIDFLVAIKGVGEWTAQMFLIFNLFRQDIFSPKDLALINSIKKNYLMESVGKVEIEKLIKKIAG